MLPLSASVLGKNLRGTGIIFKCLVESTGGTSGSGLLLVGRFLIMHSISVQTFYFFVIQSW